MSKGTYTTKIMAQPSALAGLVTIVPHLLKVLTLWHHKQRRGAGVKRQEYKLTLSWELVDNKQESNG